MPETPERIAVRCTCGTKLAVPASAVGKNAKCPKCGKVFPITLPAKVPLPAAPAVKKTAPKPSDDEPEVSLLDALAKQEQTAEATSPPPQQRMQTPCPKCKAMMAVDAQVCVSCGYNVATGRTLKGARGTQPTVVAKAATAASRLSIGVVCSAIGALVGAGIWFGVAAATGYEIGWIAWGVGLLAGLGMKLGYRSESTFAGLIAAGISVFGILAAKLMYFGYLVSPLLNYDPNSIEAMRELVIGAIADERYEQGMASSSGVPATQIGDELDEDEEDPEFTKAYAEAERQVKGMSDEEVRRRAEEYRRSLAAEPAEEVVRPTRGLLILFFVACFGLFDILFVVLAIGTAYKVASGGGVELRDKNRPDGLAVGDETLI